MTATLRTTTTLAVVRSMRPSFLVLTPVCILLGIAAAVLAQNGINLDMAILVLIGAVSAHISANTFNEYFDYANGLDDLTIRTPFSGGSGALPETPAAHNLVLAVAILTLLITSLIGFYLVSLKGPLLFVLGLIGVITIVVYSRWINRSAWLCLIAPGLAFGPLFVVGTFISATDPQYVTSQNLTTAAVLSLVPFFLVNNLLLLNQFPDVEADRQVGRNTFPIQYGLHAALNMYLFFIVLCGAVIIGSVVMGWVHWLALLALAPLLLGFNVYQGVVKEQFIIDNIIPYMGKNVALTLLTTLVFAVCIMIPLLFL